MGKFYFNTDDKGRERLKAIWLNTGGSLEKWKQMEEEWDREQIESLAVYKHEMEQRPHYGKKRPG